MTLLNMTAPFIKMEKWLSVCLVLLMFLGMCFDQGMCRPTDIPEGLDYNNTPNKSLILDSLLSTSTSSQNHELDSLQSTPTSSQEDEVSLEDITPIPDNTTAINNTSDSEQQSNSTTSDTEDGGQNIIITRPHKKELPMGMIIAGPAAILGIILFLCFTYYCHSAQLTREAKAYSIALYVSMEDSTDSSEHTAPSSISSGKVQLQSPSGLGVPRLQRENSTSSRLQRENSRKPSTLSPPPPPPAQHKRGGSWSSMNDNDMFIRRQSSFIL